MAGQKSGKIEELISRDRLAELLNEDFAREYRAIIAYVVYSQVLKGPEFMSIADQLEIHAQEELKHALILSRQIDHLGKMPSVTPKAVRTSDNAREMLRFDLDNENETIRNYRERVRQCEALGEFALQSKSAKSSWMSRTIKSIWPPRSAKTFPISLARESNSHGRRARPHATGCRRRP
jgi:bacterioferritin